MFEVRQTLIFYILSYPEFENVLLHLFEEKGKAALILMQGCPVKYILSDFINAGDEKISIFSFTLKILISLVHINKELQVCHWLCSISDALGLSSQSLMDNKHK